MTIKVKDGSKGVVIAFGNNALPLGQKTQSDLEGLVALAQSSGDKSLLAHFEILPSVSEVKKERFKQAVLEFKEK